MCRHDGSFDFKQVFVIQPKYYSSRSTAFSFTQINFLFLLRMALYTNCRHIEDNRLWSEVTQSCLTLCDPMDCSLPGFSDHGIFQARVLEWVAISFSRESSQPRDQTWVSRIVGRCFTLWATREALKIIWIGKLIGNLQNHLVLGENENLGSLSPKDT